MFWFFGLKVFGILSPQPGIESTLPALEDKVLTTEPPGKSCPGMLILFFLIYQHTYIHICVHVCTKYMHVYATSMPNYANGYHNKCLSVCPPWSEHTPWGVQVRHWEPLMFYCTEFSHSNWRFPWQQPGNYYAVPTPCSPRPLPPRYRPSSLPLGSSSRSPLLSLPSPLLDIPFINMSLKWNSQQIWAICPVDC